MFLSRRGFSIPTPRRFAPNFIEQLLHTLVAASQKSKAKTKPYRRSLTRIAHLGTRGGTHAKKTCTSHGNTPAHTENAKGAAFWTQPSPIVPCPRRDAQSKTRGQSCFHKSIQPRCVFFYTFFFFFPFHLLSLFSISLTVFAVLFFLPPCRNSDPGSHIMAGSCPPSLPTTVRALLPQKGFKVYLPVHCFQTHLSRAQTNKYYL